MSDAASNRSPEPVPGIRPGRYAWYALIVLIFVYALNFIDRQILSILAQNVKHDLDLTDAQLGFLYGTAFAVFYSIFGIPLGRMADNWHRTRLLAVGLVLWSAMTIASGLARSFPALALARIGVGVGEATATPAAFSLIAGYFPARYRGFALSIYATGAYIGLGISLPLGGWIADHWDRSYQTGPSPFGLAGWQAAFVAVGLPGLLVAAWVASLREPARDPQPGRTRNAFASFFADLGAILPPFTLWSVRRYPGALVRNLVFLAAVSSVCLLLIALTRDFGQWSSVAVGYYAVFSWAQSLRHTDRPAFTLIWGDWTIPLCLIGFGCIALVTYSAGFWAAPFAIRTFGLSPTSAGTLIGIPGAIASALGIVVGGRLSDYWKARDPRGRVFTCLVGAAVPIPLLLLMYSQGNLAIYLAISPAVYFFTALPGGACPAVCQDLVVPRMYGTVGAVYLVGTTLIGLAIGPYFTGKIATLTGSLQLGVLSMLLITPLTLLSLVLLSRRVAAAERTKDERAVGNVG